MYIKKFIAYVYQPSNKESFNLEINSLIALLTIAKMAPLHKSEQNRNEIQVEHTPLAQSYK